MNEGRVRQPYGSRWKDSHRIAYRIWLSDGDEIGDSPSFGMRSLMEVSDDDDKRGVLLREVWEWAERWLSAKELKIMKCRFELDMTPHEIGMALEISAQRVGYYENRALRMLTQVLAPKG